MQKAYKYVILRYATTLAIFSEAGTKLIPTSERKKKRTKEKEKNKGNSEDACTIVTRFAICDPNSRFGIRYHV